MGLNQSCYQSSYYTEFSLVTQCGDEMISPNLPRPVLSAAQCKALDRRAIEAMGIPGYQLMQRAAQAALALIGQRWPSVRAISVWVGGGNNGGDGVVLARLAQERGWQVQLVVAASDVQKLARNEAAEAWRDLPQEVVPQIFDAQLQIRGELIVDALLGIGVRGRVRDPIASMIERINRASIPVLALDQPSGLDTDLGVAAGVAVRADATLSFIANKLGWLTAQGPELAGERYWASLGVPGELLEQMEPYALLTKQAQIKLALPRRSRAAHKGDFGVLVVVGGNLGLGGSAIMTAEAALRSGAGRVILLTRPEHVSAALARVPEVMVQGVLDPAQAREQLSQASALVIGPGLGQDDWAKAWLELAEKFEGPCLYDADALNLIANGEARAGAGSVFTPHPGEAARLLGISTAQVQADRVAALLNLERRFGGVQVLKGAGTLCVKDGQIEVCDRGNPGMATAGMGDILSGIIGALLVQGIAPASAAACGVWIHARAGDLAAARGERGLLASDLLEQIRAAVNDNEIDNQG